MNSILKTISNKVIREIAYKIFDKYDVKFATTGYEYFNKIMSYIKYNKIKLPENE